MTLLAFVAILLLLVVGHELGHFLTARAAGVKVLEFGFGYPPRLLAFKKGETEYSLNLLPLGGFVRLLGEEDPSDPRSLAAKSRRVRLLVLASGSVMNALLPFLLLSVGFMVPQRVLVGGEGVKVAEVAPASPAQEAGLLPGDVLLSLEGESLARPEELREKVAARLGTPVTFLIERDASQQAVTLTPRAEPPPGQGALGIRITWAVPQYERQAYPPWRAVPLGVQETWHLLVAVKQGVQEMVSGREAVAVVGIIGIAQATVEVAQEGAAPLLAWAAILSLSLAIMNLLPFPMLDGGRIALVFLELARRGKRLAPQRERLIHLVGFAMLMAFILVVSYYDILRLMQGGKIIP